MAKTYLFTFAFGFVAATSGKLKSIFSSEQEIIYGTGTHIFERLNFGKKSSLYKISPKKIQCVSKSFFLLIKVFRMAGKRSVAQITGRPHR